MPFQFQYAHDIRSRFPQLRCGVLVLQGVDAKADAAPAIAAFNSLADQRLAASSEAEFPEIQAWRRAFSAMGLKPTQYRCASEALLRRYRKQGALPALHPLIDLCNAASLAFAIPVAVFDASKIAGSLAVRPAQGDEIHDAFSGETEHPDPGEIIFADEAGRAHARRWTNRQGALSAISSATQRAVIVSEALHETACRDVERLLSALGDALKATWPACVWEAVEPR